MNFGRFVCEYHDDADPRKAVSGINGLTILGDLNRGKSRWAEINSVTPCSKHRIRTLVSIACNALSPVHQVKQLIAGQQVNARLLFGLPAVKLKAGRGGDF